MPKKVTIYRVTRPNKIKDNLIHIDKNPQQGVASQLLSA